MAKLRFTFGTVVKLMREQQGLNQNELGTSQITVSQMELGNRKPSAETMKTIAQHLGTTVAEIYAEVDRLNGASGDIMVSGTVSGNAVVGSAIVGSNNSSVVVRNGGVRNGQERIHSKEIAELVRIYESLDVKLRMKLLESAFSLEEQQKAH